MDNQDPIKDMNRQKYLNNVAMKTRYDMIAVNKYNEDQGIKCYKSQWYRNYPSPCRDRDLLAFKRKVTDEDIKSYLDRIQHVTDTINNCDIIAKLDSINQTSSFKTKVRAFNEPKKNTTYYTPTTMKSSNHNSIDFRHNKKRIKHKDDRNKKSMFKNQTDIKDNKRSAFQEARTNKNEKFPLIKIREATPFLCTERLIVNGQNQKDIEYEKNLLFTKHTTIELNYPKIILSDYPIKKGDKITKIRLSKLLNKNETNINDLNPSAPESTIQTDNIQGKPAKVDHNQYLQTEPIENDSKSLMGKEMNITTNIAPMKYKQYDNFLFNKNEIDCPYPKHRCLKNYLYKKNHKGLRKTNDNYELLENKIDRTFERMNNNIINTVEYFKDKADLY